MELGSGLGGIALIVLAVVWLLIFVPGWAKKSQISANPELVTKFLPEAAAKELVKSSQLERLMRTRRVFSVVLFASLVLVAAWFAIPVLAAIGSWVPLASGSIALSALLMLVAANKTKRRIAESRIESRNALRQKIQQTLPATLESHPADNEREDLGWQPNPLPAPLSAPKVGALIRPRVADVIPIKAQEDENSEQTVNRPTIELDEILRRRRVI